jgi:single-stranded DNA-binding protein
MIDAIVSGKLVKEPELKTGPSGKHFCNFLLSVSINNEPQPIVVSAIAFEAVAERIAKLGKGDSVSVVGSLKPSEWLDKSGEVKHGLNITVNNALSPYDIKKRKPEATGGV